MRPYLETIFFIVLCMMISTPAKGDLIPRNQKHVEYEIIIENASKLKRDFYLYPTGTSFNQVQVLHPDKDGLIRTDFYRNSPPFLFALPKNEKGNDRFDLFRKDCDEQAHHTRKCFDHHVEALKKLGVAVSKEALIGHRFVPKTSEVTFIQTYYRITAIDQGIISLEKKVYYQTKEQRKQQQEQQKKLENEFEIKQAINRHRKASFSRLWSLLILPILGVTGLIWLKRKKEKS